MWLTGWDFGTYNNFHRWVARISTAQAIIHSIGYTLLIFRGLLSSVSQKGYRTNQRNRGWLGLLCVLVVLHVLVGW